MPEEKTCSTSDNSSNVYHNLDGYLKSLFGNSGLLPPCSPEPEPPSDDEDSMLGDFSFSTGTSEEVPIDELTLAAIKEYEAGLSYAQSQPQN
jgi:hypothetical protein